MWYCGGWRGRKCDIIEKIGDCGNQTYISYDSLKDRGKKMNYYKMLCEKDENKLAFVEDGIPYTYEELEKADDPALERYAWRFSGRTDRRTAGRRRVAVVGLCQ